MKSKPNILFVGNYNRGDYIDLLLKSKNDCNFFFLEFSSEKEITDRYFEQYGKAIFWGDYHDVYDLLDQTKPHKVLFLFIESYYHVLLNLACKSIGIATYLLDHGLRDRNINIPFEKELMQQRSAGFWHRKVKLISQLRARVRARLFLKNSAKKLPAPYVSFFHQFYAMRKRNHHLVTFQKLRSPLSIADAYITHSKKVYEVHQHYDLLKEEQKVRYIGFPNFDHLAGVSPRIPIRKQILLLDQGLSFRGLFGWTHEHYKNFARTLASICAQHGYQVYVKLHPIQPKEEKYIWEAYGNVHVINNTELAELLPETQLIIGFFTSYLLPIMALPFTTVVTLENHPTGKINVSKSFLEAGVAHSIYDLEELNSILTNAEELHQKQLPNKAKFTEEWMYKFDGKAGERLRDILLSDEL